MGSFPRPSGPVLTLGLPQLPCCHQGQDNVPCRHPRCLTTALSILHLRSPPRTSAHVNEALLPTALPPSFWGWQFALWLRPQTGSHASHCHAWCPLGRLPPTPTITSWMLCAQCLRPHGPGSPGNRTLCSQNLKGWPMSLRVFMPQSGAGPK